MLELAFDREFPFAPVIVWDALLDADLVAGWLADAVIEPVVGGQYSLRWLNRAGHPEAVGHITELRQLEHLRVATSTAGTIQFDLEELEGGNRGTSTLLRLGVEVEVERAFAATVRADWLTNLDQLGDLLHGHPVDWAHWDRDRHESWSRYLVTGSNRGG